MNIHELLTEATVMPNIKVAGKEDLLGRMVDSFSTLVDSEQLEAVRSAVLDREHLMSTGIGKGLAIPHGKCPGLPDNLAAVATLSHPVDFDSIDRQPVELAFMLVGPDTHSNVHIKLLSRISKLMISDAFRDRLMACTTSQQILDEFRKEEAAHQSA